MATTNRNVRIDSQTWTAAGDYAAAAGTNLSEVIRAALEDYIKRSAMELPTVRALATRITTRWPDATREAATAAIYQGAGCFNINLATMGGDDEDAILAYAAGYLGHMHDV